MSIASRLETVRRIIHETCLTCGRNPDEVTLIAVSKTHPPEAVLEAAAAGQVHFGENKVQELVSKMEAVEAAQALEIGETNEAGQTMEAAQTLETGKTLANVPAGINWHMIGVIQTNKIRQMAGRVDWIHSVSRIKELNEIDKRAAEAGRTIRVLVQVNISDEDQKSGCEPDELPALLEHASGLANLRVCGLMGMASFTDNMDVVRLQFRSLRQLRDRWRHHPDGKNHLGHLSMGMTGDLKVAIEEGSTMVRVGTAIFGEREYD